MSTFIETADNYQYFYRPMSVMRAEKFSRILSQIKGGDVLDLGCGQAGHYWALAYAHRVNSISFYDVVEENIAEQLMSIENLSPEFIEENLMETVDYLRDKGYLPANLSLDEIAENIITKTKDIRVFDFVSDTVDKKFNYIMAMESIEIADTYDDFVQSLKNAKSMLKDDGLFLGIILPYDELLPFTQDAINIKREGVLNPGIEETKQAFAEAGLKLEALETYETLQPNYSTAICFYARHN
jgi:cyclopropane fatty-acyl-phospholipid synthase-like methyltransferase